MDQGWLLPGLVGATRVGEGPDSVTHTWKGAEQPYCSPVFEAVSAVWCGHLGAPPPSPQAKMQVIV